MSAAGDLLRSARSAAGVTQGDLAVRAGTSQAAISQIERGEVEPSYDRLARLVYLTGHELQSSVVPAALLVDGELLADSFALFAEQRVSAAIALSRRAQAARAAGQAEQEAMRESEAAHLRELAGL